MRSSSYPWRRIDQGLLGTLLHLASTQSVCGLAGGSAVEAMDIVTLS